MAEIYFHEDDYCQIEILPVENFGFCLQQAGLIDEFAEEHRSGGGYTDIFVRDTNPTSIYSKRIPTDIFESALEGIQKYDEVFSGYSSYREKYEDTSAFGYDVNAAVFYQQKDGFIDNIWLALDIYEENDVSIASNILALLSNLGDFIIVDWGWSFVEKLSNAEIIRLYLQKRLEAFSDE